MELSIQYGSSQPRRFYDLLPKVLAAQQPKECFGHALDPVQHIFPEPNFSLALPFGKSLQCFIPSVPPVEYQKSMDAGPCDDELTHEPLTNVRLAKLPSKSDTTANHDASTRPEVFHDCVMDGASGVVEEDIHADGGCLFDRLRQINSFLVIDPGIEPKFLAPFEFVIVSGNCHRTTPS